MVKNSIIFGLVLSLFFTQNVTAAPLLTCTANISSEGKKEWDLRNLIIKEYKQQGLDEPNWDSDYFEEEYTYDDLWRAIGKKFYEQFAKKYNFPSNWFLLKAYKENDWSLLWDTRGEISYCDLAQHWLKLSRLLNASHPEIARWIREKIKHPDQKLPLPQSTIQQDLEELITGDKDNYILKLTLNPYSDQSFTHQIIKYAKELKAHAKQLQRSAKE